MQNILLTQQISNLQEKGFEKIKRTVNVTSFHIDGGEYAQIILNYFISYERDKIDVTHIFKTQSDYQWIITNNNEIITRDDKFEPVVDKDGNLVKAPAFDYLLQVFQKYEAIPFTLLRGYILENDNDKLWDLK